MSENSSNIAKNISLYPNGVHDKTIILRFDSDNLVNSSINSEGNSMIQCVALDDVLPEYNPTFINMDIEGNELSALKGASKMIVNSLPDLAICVYHRPRDLWEISTYIKNLSDKYNLYLRNYTSFPAETVLYATIR